MLQFESRAFLKDGGEFNLKNRQTAKYKILGSTHLPGELSESAIACQQRRDNAESVNSRMTDFYFYFLPYIAKHPWFANKKASAKSGLKTRELRTNQGQKQEEKHSKML